MTAKKTHWSSGEAANGLTHDYLSLTIKGKNQFFLSFLCTNHNQIVNTKNGTLGEIYLDGEGMTESHHSVNSDNL